jgi:acetyl-CoA synthetase
VFRALIEEAGAAWADDPHELLELARVLAEPRARPTRGALTPGGGLAVLTCSGGDSGIAADLAEGLGIPLPPLAEGTKAELRGLLPEAATPGNPLDYTSLIWGERERLAAIAEAVGNDPAISQLLIFHDTPEDLTAENEPGWRETRRGLADGAQRASAAPLFASTLPDLIGEREIGELRERGIAAVQGLGTAMRCVAALASEPAAAERLREIGRAAEAAGRAREREGESGAWLSEAQAKDLLAHHGVPVPDRAVAEGAERAAEIAAALGYPVALKLSSAALQHKSDIGALELGIAGPETLAAACERMLALPQAAASDAQLLVERMAEPGAELIVAVRGDAVVPALVIGLGGIWTEVLGDAAVVPLPASPERVERAIRSLRGAPILAGGRGTTALDVAAAAAAAARIGAAAMAAGLELVEVNPLIVRPVGALAVDAAIRGA